MKRRTGWAVAAAIVLTASLALTAGVLLRHERGPQFALRLAQRLAPGELQWQATSGTLSGPLHVTDLEYVGGGARYRIGKLSLDWDPSRLLARHLVVHSMRLSDVDVALTAADGDGNAHPAAELPLAVELDDVHVDNLRVRRGEQTPIVIDRLRLAAAGTAERLNVETFSLHMAQGDVEAQGRIGLAPAEKTALALSWRMSLPEYAEFSGQGELNGTGERLQLTQHVIVPHDMMTVQIDIEQPFVEPRWRTRATVPALSLSDIHPRWPKLRVDGTLVAEGVRDRYDAELNAQVEGAAVPPAELTAAAAGDRDGVRIDRLSVRTLGGDITGTARVNWSAPLHWEAQLQARDIDPGRTWAAWPGTLAARIHGSGRHTEQGMKLNVRLDQMGGALRGYPVSGGGAFALENGMMRLDDTHLRSGTAQVRAQGSVGAAWDLRWNLAAPALEQLVAAYSGAVSAHGTLRGPRAEPHMQMQAAARDVVGPDIVLAALQLDADVNLRPQSPLKVALHAAGARFAQRDFSSADLVLGGRLERHAFALKLRGAEHGLQLHADGGWEGTQWRGRMERADWRMPELGAWRLAEPVALHLARAQGALDKACWQQAPAQLCAQVDYSPRGRQLRAQLREASLAQFRALPAGVRVEGANLNAEVSAKTSTNGAAAARAELRLAPGTVSWPQGAQRRRTAFDGGNMRLRLDADGARAEAQLRLSGADRLDLEAAAPGYGPGVPPAQQSLSGRIYGEVRDLSLLNAMLESIDELSALLRLDAALTGTLAAPRLYGELQLNEGRMFVGPAGVQLEDVQMALFGDGADGALQLRGSARSGPGRIAVEGRLLDHPPEDAPATDALAADIRLTGTDFEAADLPEAWVLASPDLRFAIRGRVVTVDGSVHIPQAHITPRDVSGAVTPSRDVLRVDAHAPVPATGWTVASRVRVSLGDQVKFKGFGVQGRLAGALDVVDDAGKQPRARGELAIQDGVYGAYGQELKIERGRARYRDSPLDNPGLDVRATRKSGSVLAGVRVLGTVHEPVAELYSQPPLPDADVLSYLLLGRPVAAASGSEGELLFKAATTLGLKGGGRLAQTIGRRFGLDEVAMSGSELESAALTLGKYLSPRLYLSYSIGLLDAVDRLRLRYQLTEHLSVQTETGAGAGGDVLYTIER